MLLEDVAFNMNRATVTDFPLHTLTAGYQLRAYQPGDDRTWTEIHLASEPFIKFDDTMFERQFGTQLDALPDRMYFVETDAGRAIASITAWWDANWRDTGEWGRIHWVVVHPAYQRRGLTKPMMTHAMRRLAQSHAARNPGHLLWAPLGRQSLSGFWLCTRSSRVIRSRNLQSLARCASHNPTPELCKICLAHQLNRTLGRQKL